jgi:hypothetical protein
MFDLEVQEIEKNLKLLRNPATNFIRKRQVMFHSCGDYRKQMSAEEAKRSAESGFKHLFSQNLNLFLFFFNKRFSIRTP